MKNLIISILVVILAGGLYITNPDKVEFVGYLSKEISKESDSGLENALKSLFSKPIAQLLAQKTKVKDYGIFSLYYVELADHKKTYIGVLGDFYMIKESNDGQ